MGSIMPQSFFPNASSTRLTGRLPAFLVLLLTAALIAGCVSRTQDEVKDRDATTAPQPAASADATKDAPTEAAPQPADESAKKEDVSSPSPATPPKETPPPAKSAEPGDDTKQPESPPDASKESEKNPEESASDFDGMNLDLTPEELAEWKKEQEEFRKKELQQRRKAIAALGKPLVDDAEGMTRLDPFFPVWLDPANKRVVMLGAVAQQRAPLEMFACLRATKEHESVVVVDTKAFIVHAGLLTLGAEAGPPVKFQPEYTPAGGTEIAIEVRWKDKDGKVRSAKAQDWVRNTETGKAMTLNWVFAGSGFWVDERTGKRHYRAEGGDFICVSNFPSAMLDLPIESTQTNSGLMFEAFTENIPPIGTPVTVILEPQLKTKEKKEEEK